MNRIDQKNKELKSKGKLFYSIISATLIIAIAHLDVLFSAFAEGSN